MSATATRLPLAEAEAVAERLIFQLGGAYGRIELAGSLRRRLPTVGDIELVAIPARYVEVDLFGEPCGETDLLALRCAALEEAGVIARRRAWNDAVIGWGPLAKYLVFEDVAVDLFSPPGDRFGWILALRTGPNAFSNQLVTPVGQTTRLGRPGLMPRYLASRDGWLTYRVSGEKIPVREERDVFEMFELPYAEPWERT